jgi:hypothetical protein
LSSDGAIFIVTMQWQCNGDYVEYENMGAWEYGNVWIWVTGIGKYVDMGTQGIMMIEQ